MNPSATLTANTGTLAQMQAQNSAASTKLGALGNSISIAPAPVAPTAPAGLMGVSAPKSTAPIAGSIVPSSSVYTPPVKLPLPTSSSGKPAVFGSSSSGNATAPTGSLSDYITTPQVIGQGANGYQASPFGVGTIATDSSGNTTTSPGFNINTSGASTADLGSNTTSSDVANQHSQYQQYLNQLAQASGYSPDYLAANAAVNYDTTNAANLGNQINNPYAPGDTLGQLQTTIGRNQAQNTAQQAADQIALQTQTLNRTGSINAATVLAQGNSPTALNQSVAPGSTVINGATGQPIYSGLGGLTAVNAIDQYNSLQQSYPGAGIPAYDQSKTPAENQQIAMSAVANSPAYQSQFLTTYTTPGGGTGILNKANTGLLQQNTDGTYSLVSGAEAAIGKSNADSLDNQVGTLNTTQTAFNTVDTIFGQVTNLMNQYGLNQSGVPLITQLQNKVSAGLIKPGAVAAFQAGIQELRTNLATVISRGGSVAGSTDEAKNLVPDNLSPSQMGQLGSAIQSNGKAAIQQIQNQITQTIGNVSSGTVGGNSGSTGNSVGSSWANLLTQ